MPRNTSINAKVRAEHLDQHWFISLDEAKEQVGSWHQEDNEQRPHSSLNNQTPAEFMRHWLRQEHLKKPQPKLQNELLLEGRAIEHLAQIVLARRRIFFHKR